MFSNFEQANEYLETLIPKEYKPTEALKLERITYLLKLLGKPHQKFKSIHVGGTSGKGSVCYYLSQILTAQGYKTGLHISPHLQTIRERMQINGELISEKEFVNLVNKIKPLVEETEKNLSFDKPSYFEATVAIAFDYFAKANVDIAVVEVGLGGKLDATNVIHPLISIITNVGLDHTEILGHTVEKIARDKSGIIKKNVPVISGAQQLAVKKVIAKKSLENSSKIFFINEKFGYKIREISFSGTKFDFRWFDRVTSHQLSTPASYQVENASLALGAVNLLAEHGFKIKEEKLYKSLANAKVPGRFEIAQKKLQIILDGAHNPVKAKALINSLTSLIPNQKFVFIVAFKKDKDIEKMLKILKPHAKAFVITEFTMTTDMGQHFAARAEEVVKIFKSLKFSGKVLIEKNSKNTLKKAKQIADLGDAIIATGSLYLVGELRNLFYPTRDN
ncbi:MAG: folylpolyglutamate synthase/dihydrofolate synthase family protein [Candidatus Woykebacteria bacterium]